MRQSSDNSPPTQTGEGGIGFLKLQDLFKSDVFNVHFHSGLELCGV